MKLLSAFRKENFKKILPLCITFFIISILMFFAMGVPSLLKSFAPKTFAKVNLQQMEGAYVEDDIGIIYASYAEEFSANENGENVVTGTYYLIDFGEQYYISLFAAGDQMAQANALEAASYDYMDGIYPMDEASLRAFPAMRAKGTLVPMDKQLAQYYYELAEGNPSMKSIMLPYTLDTAAFDATLKAQAWVGVVGSFSSMLVGLMLAVALFADLNQKQFLKAVDTMGDRELILEKIDQLYHATPAQHGLRISDEFLLFRQPPSAILLRTNEIVHFYKKRIGIGSTYAVMVDTIDGTTHTLPLVKKEIDGAIAHLTMALPQASPAANTANRR